MSETNGMNRLNKLWEGSRMILPEHREQYLDFRRGLGHRTRPEYDEQQMEMINEMLQEALSLDYPVTFCLYQEGLERTVEGSLLNVSGQKLKIRLPSGRVVYESLHNLLAIRGLG
jgi:hypothetical protein